MAQAKSSEPIFRPGGLLRLTVALVCFFIAFFTFYAIARGWRS